MLKQTLEKVNSKNFEIEVFGLGYIGFPLAIRLAKSGFKVRGIDVNPERISRLEANHLMDSEINLKDTFLECRKNGKLSFSKKSEKSEFPKIGIICVPTPIATDGIKSNMFVKLAIENFLETSKKGDIIIIESSVEVGTTEEMRELIESKGVNVGQNFGLCCCPERIDPQNKKWDLQNIPRIIYCSDDISFAISKKIYAHVNNSNLIRVNSPKVAEVVKSFENAFRLVNISLVNELAILCEKLEINVKEVIDAAATKPFGFMPFYSGAGAGGHCIPKDPLFLLNSSKKYKSNFQTISNALEINQFIPKHIADSIEKTLSEMKLSKSVIVCGLSYKSDIEDMRDSPGFKVIKELKNNGFNVAVFDPFFKEEL
ncbi:MAG: nucleotide sugar dehydrogenase, partial [Nitrosopumilus sp.]